MRAHFVVPQACSLLFVPPLAHSNRYVCTELSVMVYLCINKPDIGSYLQYLPPWAHSFAYFWTELSHECSLGTETMLASILLRFTLLFPLSLFEGSSRNERINRILEMTSDALTNAGMRVTSNIALSQQYKQDSVFWLTQMTLCVMTLHNFPPFFRPNVISDGPTTRLLMCQLLAAC